MKNRLLIVLLLIFCFAFAAKAQNRTHMPFFDERGFVRVPTTELDVLADTIATVWHRRNDIVWRQTVYRIIDMRERQNHRLYFPIRPDHPTHRNLFYVILDAVVNHGLTVYERGIEFTPRFDRPLTPEDLRSNLQLRVESEFDPNAYLVGINALGAPYIVTGNFASYMRDQLQFVIQEVVFFNRHTSRMYTQIVAIAPLYLAHPHRQTQNLATALQTSILFWVPFHNLRPFLARRQVLNPTNQAQLLSFDDFFALRMYNSYILAGPNVFGRTLLDYAAVIDDNERLERFIRMEQDRIQTVIMNFEQDLWEW